MLLQEIVYTKCRLTLRQRKNIELFVSRFRVLDTLDTLFSSLRFLLRQGGDEILGMGGSEKIMGKGVRRRERERERLGYGERECTPLSMLHDPSRYNMYCTCIQSYSQVQTTQCKVDPASFMQQMQLGKGGRVGRGGRESRTVREGEQNGQGGRVGRGGRESRTWSEGKQDCVEGRVELQNE